MLVLHPHCGINTIQQTQNRNAKNSLKEGSDHVK